MPLTRPSCHCRAVNQPVVHVCVCIQTAKPQDINVQVAGASRKAPMLFLRDVGCADCSHLRTLMASRIAPFQLGWVPGTASSAHFEIANEHITSAAELRDFFASLGLSCNPVLTQRLVDWMYLEACVQILLWNAMWLAYQRSRLEACRLAQPEEIAAGIAFLASSDASFMTGSELVMDGGMTI